MMYDVQESAFIIITVVILINAIQCLFDEQKVWTAYISNRNLLQYYKCLYCHFWSI